MRVGVTCALVGVILAGGLTALRAQAPSGSQTFEVASIKPSDESAAASSPIGAIPMMTAQPGGRANGRNLPLRLLVRLAYGVQDFQIVGGPDWQMSKKFDITAKAPDGFSGGIKEMQPMLKTLLG